MWIYRADAMYGNYHNRTSAFKNRFAKNIRYSIKNFPENIKISVLYVKGLEKIYCDSR